MTNQTETVLSVQVLLPNKLDVAFPVDDILLEGDSIATMSDRTLIERVARHLDMEISAFQGMIVSRPRTGNILVMPEPTFG